MARFPFADRSPNQLSWVERDQLYTRLHEWPEPVHRHDSGLLMVWRHGDVKEVLAAETPGITNTNSLDPLVGFPRIMATPTAIPPFLRHLVPLPAKATANLTDATLHKRVWDTMAGPDGHFTIPPGERDDRAEAVRAHFHAVLPHFQTDGALDVTGLSVAFAARVTGSAVGLSHEDWPRVAAWSGAQSGLLGQRPRGRELAAAVAGLGQLFTVSDRALRRAETGFAAHLRAAGLPHRVAVAAMANSLAAGVHTIAGTVQQGVQRLLSDPDRVWWSLLDDRVATRICHLDPGLVAWKRRVTRPVTLSSGTVLERGPVLALFAAANRDPAAFDDPFDLDGRGKPPLTFGFGAHVCPGRQLATLAVTVFLRELRDLATRATLIPSPAPGPRRHDLLFSGADVSIAT